MENVILSYGLGVESTAILLRWIFEPETRPCPLEHLTVITAQTGDEYPDTGRDVEHHVLSLLRQHAIRYVEVARHGHKEADGITVLSDSRSPERLHLEGDYSLSDELRTAGTVPSYAGAHRCSMKFKGFVIEKWLSEYYASPSSYRHAFGYNSEELSRVAKSEKAIQKHVAFGFNAEEVSRVTKAAIYDTPTRSGFYPLVEWGWNRQACLDYIDEKLGVRWQKSCCTYCPFSYTKHNLDTLITRQKLHPQETAQSLMLEHVSLCLNPRGGLYRSETLAELSRRNNNTAALEEFERIKAASIWAIYRVRRLYGAKAQEEPLAPTKKGTVQRAVEKVEVFASEDEALNELNAMATHAGTALDQHSGIAYLFLERRVDSYPAREEYLVAAPAAVETKARYGISAFDGQWLPAQADLHLL